MQGYGQRLGRGFGAGEAAVLIALGVTAGALALWLASGARKEKISLGKLGDLQPRDWLAKAAQALQQGRERLIHVVEERAAGSGQ